MARSDDQVETYGVAQAPGFARRTAINLLGRVNQGLNELTDGTVCSVDAVTGAAIGPYRKSGLGRVGQVGRVGRVGRVGWVRGHG